VRKPGSSRPSSKENPERLPGSPAKPATSPFPESQAHDEKEDPHDPGHHHRPSSGQPHEPSPPTRPAESMGITAPAGPKEELRLSPKGYGLSSREQEVVDLAVRGASTKQISPYQTCHLRFQRWIEQSYHPLGSTISATAALQYTPWKASTQSTSRNASATPASQSPSTPTLTSWRRSTVAWPTPCTARCERAFRALFLPHFSHRGFRLGSENENSAYISRMRP
jgi:hypothetical protein